MHQITFFDNRTIPSPIHFGKNNNSHSYSMTIFHSIFSSVFVVVFLFFFLLFAQLAIVSAGIIDNNINNNMCPVNETSLFVRIYVYTIHAATRVCYLCILWMTKKFHIYFWSFVHHLKHVKRKFYVVNAKFRTGFCFCFYCRRTNIFIMFIKQKLCGTRHRTLLRISSNKFIYKHTHTHGSASKLTHLLSRLILLLFLVLLFL